MGVDNPTLKWTFVMPTKRAETSGADTKPRPSVSVPVITESWQVQVLVRVPGYADRLSVNIQPAKGGDEILQTATSALRNLPNPDEVLQWSDSRCKQFLRKSSDLWKELGPVVFALSAHLPTAAKYLWDELSDPPPEGQEDKDEDLWVGLRTRTKSNAAFGRYYIQELLICVQELCNCLSPSWKQQGIWKLYEACKK